MMVPENLSSKHRLAIMYLHQRQTQRALRCYTTKQLNILQTNTLPAASCMSVGGGVQDVT